MPDSLTAILKRAEQHGILQRKVVKGGVTEYLPTEPGEPGTANKWSPDQPRDEQGRFGSGGGSSTGKVSSSLASVERGEAFSQKSETAHAFDKDGNPILTKGGNENTVTFTDDDVNALYGATLTHNHPSGTSFSPSDIAFASTSRLNEIRAYGTNSLGQKVIHSAKPGVRGWPKPSEIERRIPILSDAVRYSLLQKIDAGEMSLDEANAGHWHATWTRLSETMPLNFVYERTVL